METEVATGVVRSETEYLLLEKETNRGYSYFEFTGGKIENEEPEDAVLREFFEETGQSLDSIDRMIGFPKYRVEKSTKDFVIHPYELIVEEVFEPELAPEHENYEWVSRSFLEKSIGNNLGPERIRAIEAVEEVDDRYDSMICYRATEDIPSIDDLYREYQKANI